jgi:hypothetical protein
MNVRDDNKMKRWRNQMWLFMSLGRKYAWRRLVNGARILLGHKRQTEESDLFFWQYVWHLTGLRPIRKITCLGIAGEGAGSQALVIMSAINFARSSGLTYVHTRFSDVAHAQRSQEDWDAAWETFFNLGLNEPVCDLARREVIDYCRHATDLRLCFGWRGREKELDHRFAQVLPEFRRKYHANKSPRDADDVVTVAVHVRRGDALPGNPWYYTSNESVRRTLDSVRAVLDRHDVKYRIRLYSQGKMEDFAELSSAAVELFLDADAVWTLQEMIEASVLILAKGCYSYYAALISGGIKVGGPNLERGEEWSPCTPERWIRCEPDGSFDGEAFEREFLAGISPKATTVANCANSIGCIY